MEYFEISHHIKVQYSDSNHIIIIMYPSYVYEGHVFSLLSASACTFFVLGAYFKNNLSDCLEILHTTLLGDLDVHVVITVLCPNFGSVLSGLIKFSGVHFESISQELVFRLSSTFAHDTCREPDCMLTYI